jgi:hypothetical protein
VIVRGSTNQRWREQEAWKRDKPVFSVWQRNGMAWLGRKQRQCKRHQIDRYLFVERKNVFRGVKKKKNRYGWHTSACDPLTARHVSNRCRCLAAPLYLRSPSPHPSAGSIASPLARPTLAQAGPRALAFPK